jgi:hypothetical protein
MAHLRKSLEDFASVRARTPAGDQGALHVEEDVHWLWGGASPLSLRGRRFWAWP